VEQVWTGKCANDIVRPDGQVAVKATGKDFVCHVCMVIELDDDGKITRIDEYYNRRWDDGIEESEYAVMKGASTKK
jgi:ketosteroid isomerase-like protein